MFQKILKLVYSCLQVSEIGKKNACDFFRAVIIFQTATESSPVPSSPNIPVDLLKLRVRQQIILLSTGHGAAAVSRIFGNFFNSVHCLLKSIDFRLQHMAVDSNPAFNFSRPEWQLPGTIKVTF